MSCSELQCVVFPGVQSHVISLCCSELPWVAMCCSVLQFVAVSPGVKSHVISLHDYACVCMMMSVSAWLFCVSMIMSVSVWWFLCLHDYVCVCLITSQMIQSNVCMSVMVMCRHNHVWSCLHYIKWLCLCLCDCVCLRDYVLDDYAYVFMIMPHVCIIMPNVCIMFMSNHA